MTAQSYDEAMRASGRAAELERRRRALDLVRTNRIETLCDECGGRAPARLLGSRDLCRFCRAEAIARDLCLKKESDDAE